MLQIFHGNPEALETILTEILKFLHWMLKILTELLWILKFEVRTH